MDDSSILMALGQITTFREFDSKCSTYSPGTPFKPLSPRRSFANVSNRVTVAEVQSAKDWLGRNRFNSADPADNSGRLA
jgi:hypothetical protein